MAKGPAKPRSPARSRGPMTLAEVRKRIDALDAKLLKLIDERAAMARDVIAAKGEDRGLPIRTDRESAVLRGLLAQPRSAAGARLVITIWRELMGENLALQDPALNLSVWGGRDPAHVGELARIRFGAAFPMEPAATPEDALAAARRRSGIAVLALDGGQSWWGRLLAEPRLKVFAAMPDLSLDGPISALAVGDVDLEPTGADETFWVTDSARVDQAIEDALSNLGFAARPIAAGGGLKLFGLAGYVQRNDERLARAPGSLTGVIGAAPQPFDL
ncbi:MAG: chorismate mutase [Caulobacteraceae bacterium]|nr:chorismate mutase [Caulobacteraceae bacterium]